MDRSAQSRSKFRYAVPGIIVLVMWTTLCLVHRSTVLFQLDTYAANRSQIIDEWEREGMDRGSLDRTIDDTNIKYYNFNVFVAKAVLCAELEIAIAAISGDITLQDMVSIVKQYVPVSLIASLLRFCPFLHSGSCRSAVLISSTLRRLGVLQDRFNLADILEYLQIIHWQHLNVPSCVKFVYSLGILPALLTIAILLTFGCLTYKHTTVKERIFHGCDILSMLVIILLYCCYNPLLHRPNPLGTPMTEYMDIDPERKDEIFRLVAKYGLEPGSVLVSESENINVSAYSNLRYRVISCTSKALKLDQGVLMAILIYGLVYIASNNFITSECCRLTTRVISSLFGIGAYRAVRSHCNELGALVVVTNFSNFFSKISEFVINYYFNHSMVFRADYEAFRSGYGTQLIEYLKMVRRGENGVLFDYTDCFGMFHVHPSSLSRIKALRKYCDDAS